jgi:5-methyltetrahydrofolate corrinoid/iron sulfur protein methyltransferase
MLHKQGLYSAIVDAYDKELMSLCKGEMPEIYELVVKVMGGQAVDLGGLSEKEKQYVKTVNVLMGKSLYSHSWLEV